MIKRRVSEDESDVFSDVFSDGPMNKIARHDGNDDNSLGTPSVVSTSTRAAKATTVSPTAVRSDIQSKHCSRYDRKIGACRDCRSKQSGKQCRFIGFRKIRKLNRGSIEVTGFTTADDATAEDVVLYSHASMPDSTDHACSILSLLKKPFIELVESEANVKKYALDRIARMKCDVESIAAHEVVEQLAPSPLWRRPLLGMRQLCDSCSTSIFNGHWVCHECGTDLCIDCYKLFFQSDGNDKCPTETEVDGGGSAAYENGASEYSPLTAVSGGTTTAADSAAATISPPRWGSPELECPPCFMRLPHYQAHFMFAQLIPPECFSKICNTLLERLDAIAAPLPLLSNSPDMEEEEDSDVLEGVPHTWIAEASFGSVKDQRLLRLDDPSHPGSERAFQAQWQRGKPVVVAGLQNRINMAQWTPSSLEACFPNSTESAVLDVTGRHVGHRVSVNQFWRSFTYGHISADVDDDYSDSVKCDSSIPETGPEPVVLNENDMLSCRRSRRTSTHSRDVGAIKTTETRSMDREKRKRYRSMGNESSNHMSMSHFMLKLKDWPSNNHFRSCLPWHCNDLMNALPFPDYVLVDGRRNLTRHIPSYFCRPDLGPKMYSAYGQMSISSRGTTNLHLDISDAVNLMTFVSDIDPQLSNATTSDEPEYLCDGDDIIVPLDMPPRPEGPYDVDSAIGYGYSRAVCNARRRAEARLEYAIRAREQTRRSMEQRFRREETISLKAKNDAMKRERALLQATSDNVLYQQQQEQGEDQQQTSLFDGPLFDPHSTSMSDIDGSRPSISSYNPLERSVGSSFSKIPLDLGQYQNMLQHQNTIQQQMQQQSSLHQESMQHRTDQQLQQMVNIHTLSPKSQRVMCPEKDNLWKSMLTPQQMREVVPSQPPLHMDTEGSKRTSLEEKARTTECGKRMVDAIRIAVDEALAKDIPGEQKQQRSSKVDNHISDVLLLNEGELCEDDGFQYSEVGRGTDRGAWWDIFPVESADGVRNFLGCIASERKLLLEDPLHDQFIYVDYPLRRRLARDAGITGWRFVQRLGDAVFIPAGAPHQVRNLQSCVKVAEDFVSAEHTEECLHLSKQFRTLSKKHSQGEDKIQIKSVVFHSVKEVAGGVTV